RVFRGCALFGRGLRFGLGLGVRSAAHRHDHVEGVVLAAQLSGDDAHRAGGDQAAAVHAALDPLHVGLHRLHDLDVVALDRTGAHDQQVLGGHVDERQAGQLAAGHGVVDVRHLGEHVAQALQAELDVVADVAADVQAGITAQQVPTVGDVVALGDLDVAAGAAGRLQAERGDLVMAALRVDDRVGHAGTRLGGDDLPAAVAEV